MDRLADNVGLIFRSGLKLGVRDPRRKRYLTARLLQLDNEIRNVMGFTEGEVKANDVAGPANIKQVESKAYNVPLPEWHAAADKKRTSNTANGETGFDSVRKAREESLPKVRSTTQRPKEGVIARTSLVTNDKALGTPA